VTCTGESQAGVCATNSFEPGYVVDDPHFVGLNGHKYEFQGEPNKVFALISDPHVQVNARFVTAAGLGPHTQSSTVMGDICVRFCDSTAVFTANGTVSLSGPASSNLVVKKARHNMADVAVGLWSMRVVPWGPKGRPTLGQPFHNLKLLHLQHAAVVGPTHGVFGVTRPNVFSNETSVHPHCQSLFEGGCEVPGEFRDYEVQGDDLCGTNFKYSLFDSDKCSSIVASSKRGQPEANLLREIESFILH